MADMVTQKNIAAYLVPVVASTFAQATAGGAGNAAAVTGLTVQRSPLGLPRNAALVLAYSTSLTSAKTLSLGTVLIQTSPDGATWSNFQAFTDPGVVATGPGGGGVVEGQVTLQAFLDGASDYVRVLFTPTLNNTATDTATVVAMLLFAGFDRLPGGVVSV